MKNINKNRFVSPPLLDKQIRKMLLCVPKTGTQCKFSWKQLRKRNMFPNTVTSVSFEHKSAKYFLESFMA